MKITAFQTPVAHRAATTSQAPRVDSSPPTQEQETVGEQPPWRDSLALQGAAWTGVSLAATAVGALAGPQAGLLVGGALGAAVGIATTHTDRSLASKAGAALWGFFVGHACGVIGSASAIGGAVTAAMTGPVSGWAMTRLNRLPESQI